MSKPDLPSLATTTKISEAERIAIAQTLRRFYGSIQAVANDCGVRKQTVYTWLEGRMTSANIAAAAKKKAEELIQKERERLERRRAICDSAAA